MVTFIITVFCVVTVGMFVLNGITMWFVWKSRKKNNKDIKRLT